LAAGRARAPVRKRDAADAAQGAEAEYEYEDAKETSAGGGDVEGEWGLLEVACQLVVSHRTVM
jgi:hypothetical protein